jgi:hypothetical protein
VLPRRRIRELASRLGVVRRRRKLDIVAFVYSLVLGFSSGDRRTLGGLRRGYLRATGVRLAPSSFYARFSESLTSLFRTLALDALSELSRHQPKLKAAFAPLREVLAVDCALLRLHDALEPFYPSVWTHYMKASAKLCVVMNVIGRGAKLVTITHGSRHDRHLLHAGPWVKGRLLIFDLGFYRVPLFQQIDEHGGYFLSRMRKHGNPVIVRSHKRLHRDLDGIELNDAQHIVGTATLDVEAEMGFGVRHERRPYVTNHRARFRCVALYNAELGQWHRYITNLPPTLMRAEHMTAVYAARWEVELLFRELKKSYRIEQPQSKSRHVTETLIYAALLTLVVSRALQRALRARWKADPWRLPIDRWAVLVAAVADQLLALLTSRRDRSWRAARIERFLRAEANDPNQARIPLPFRAELGLCWPS